MKYIEKINHAKAYISQLKKGVLEEEILQKLSNEGITEYNITKIKSAAKTLLREDYREKIKTYLLEGNLEDHLEEFKLVDPKTFEEIQNEAVDSIKSKCSAQVNKLHREGKSAEEIVSFINNDFYNIEDVNRQINKHQYHQEPNKDKYLWILAGVAITTLGVFLTMRSMSTGDSSKIYYGLVIAGVLMLVKSGQTQAEIDGENKVKRGWFS